MENINEITQYSINNLINPINNEMIEGNCSFIIKYYDNNYENNYYGPDQYILSCHIYSNLINVPYLEMNDQFLAKNNNSLPDMSIRTGYYKPRIYIGKTITCAKRTIFTINEVKDKKCLDGTYTFKIIGTLSNPININNITIRDTIENDIRIFCYNLSYYSPINGIDYYSFDCYVINDISNDYLTITLLDTPPNSKFISINYSQNFTNNKQIYFNFRCINEYKSNDFDEEFNSTLSLFYSFNDKSLVLKTL